MLGLDKFQRKRFMNIILSLAITLLFGVFSVKVSKWLNLPSVTGYLLVGVLVGPYGLNILSSNLLGDMNLITIIALGFIAFSIGEELHVKSLKKIGKGVVIITLLQSLVAVLFVMGGLFIVMWIDPSLVGLPTILLLGAIATATAPASTLMVIKQYKAKGKLTDTLLPVVALDDAVGLIVFSICFALAENISGAVMVSYASVLLMAVLEILASILIGVVLGIALVFLVKWIKNKSAQFVLALLFVLLGVGLTQIEMEFELSALLICMAIGFVFVNDIKPEFHVFSEVDTWTIPLYMLFFILAGANLDFAVLPTVGVVGVVYLIMRAAGKYVGAYAGANIAKSPEPVKKYLGFTLLPQAGVAIGMAKLVAEKSDIFPYAEQVVAIVLCATFIYAFIGPIATKIALFRAGEIEKTKGSDHHLGFVKRKTEIMLNDKIELEQLQITDEKNKTKS